MVRVPSRLRVGTRVKGRVGGRAGNRAKGREGGLLRSVLEVRGELFFQGPEVRLVGTQEPEVEFPWGRVTGLTLKDGSTAVFPQENVTLREGVHNLMDKLKKVLLVLRASGRERGNPQ
jgi:hypothetical protein